MGDIGREFEMVNKENNKRLTSWVLSNYRGVSSMQSSSMA